MESTLDFKFLMETYVNNIREFFAEKIGQMEAFQDAQTQEIEALTHKLIMLGSLAIILMVAIIVLCIAFRISKKSRAKKERKKYKKAEASLRREEERLREEREYYEEQNRRRVYVEDIHNNYGYSDSNNDYEGKGFTDEIFFSKYEDDYDDVIITEWTPGQNSKNQNRNNSKKKGIFSRDTSYTVRKNASKTTQISGDMGSEYMDAINKTGYKEWDDENWQ